MTPTGSGSNYSIQSNGFGPRNSCQKPIRREFQAREEAQSEASRASSSSQMLDSTSETLLQSPEADITAITVIKPEAFPTGNSGDIPASVKKPVYDIKEEGVGTSAKPLGRDHELLSSSEESFGTIKDRGSYEGLYTHVLQRKCPKDKGLVERPEHFVRGPEERAGKKEGQQPSGSSSSTQQGKESPKEQSEGQERGKRKGKVQVEQTLPTELQNSKERKDSHGKCIKYGKNVDGIQKQGGGKN
ncbi:hypothetical protein O181_052004 [Austropuccinia psidii MF-1]|uniref:Uncharacterized protein n=1 Tax=Austropuccinia psidii MF-1 TaxID=1389203 RepID=A0A9Q3HR91_9BASI|nr:hypothetical protein [Austropuccinia psidii MF-1]